MVTTALIDAHCHLDFEIFDADRSEVLQRAKKNAITEIIIPGTEKKYWNRIRILCEQYPQLHACYGLHPYWINDHDKQDIAELKDCIDINQPIAIGECGLDFRSQQADKKTQLYYFEAQLGLAEDCQLPLVIHSVKATEMVIQTIKKFKNVSGMIHSYSGSEEQAAQLIDLNFRISLGAGVTYDNASKIRNIARNIPLTSLLLETDSPDQPGQKHSGKRNEPAYLADTLDVISNLREETPQTVAQQTTLNARKLFAI